MPFGKHKGKRLREVPRDYLEWLRAADGIAPELRDAIEVRLQEDAAIFAAQTNRRPNNTHNSRRNQF
jgi:hypothetical protein